MSVASYRDLRVWQEGMDLAEHCYRLTAGFPREELFGMISQIRRAAASIPANIAEGYGRGSTGEYLQFLRVAQGSLRELETHVLLALRVGLTTSESADPILRHTDKLGGMLYSLQRAVKPA